MEDLKNTEEIKLIFTANKIRVSKNVNLGLFGEIETFKDLDYEAFPQNVGLYVTKIVPKIKVSNEQKIVETIELYIKGFNTNIDSSTATTKATYRINFSKLSFVGNFVSPLVKKNYQVYMSENTYYIKREGHTYSMLIEDFDKCYKWLIQQPLPVSYMKLQESAVKEGLVKSKAAFWVFFVIALAKGSIEITRNNKMSIVKLKQKGSQKEGNLQVKTMHLT